MISDNIESIESKLIILYILDKLDLPLEKNQLSNIILENNFLNYFTLQQCLLEIESSDLVIIEGDKSQLWRISSQGRNAVSFLSDFLTVRVKNTIDRYVHTNKLTIKKESEIKTSYKKINDDEFIVTLVALENGMELINLELNVVSGRQAQQICENWKKNAEQIYGMIIGSLLT